MDECMDEWAGVTAAADQAVAARLSYERQIPGWYVANPSTGIVCGGPFPTFEQADTDRERREDRATELTVFEV